MIKSSLLLYVLLLGAVSLPAMTPVERIDALVKSGLLAHNLQPNAAIDDATFLRRIYLGIAGRIPTFEESDAFRSSRSPKKRSEVIQHLLQGEGSVANAYHFWADLLRVNGRDATVSDGYELWLKDALRSNKPYDRMVRELVTAQGDIWENGAIGYYVRDRGMPLDNMANTVRVFLGVRLECAQCHDHPFDDWSQMDFYRMAAFSYGMQNGKFDKTDGARNRVAVVERFKKAEQQAYRDAVFKVSGIKDFPGLGSGDKKIDKLFGSAKGRAWIQRHGLDKTRLRELRDIGKDAKARAELRRRGATLVLSELYGPLKRMSVLESVQELKLPHDYAYNDAQPLSTVGTGTMFGERVSASRGESPIAVYARWLTSPQNPTFTKVIVNRLWKEVFGAGLIEPVDDITDYSKASNPELLGYLEDLFQELNYDIKAFLGILYNSQAYQREVNHRELEPGEACYFPGPTLRRMSAEQVWDSIVGLAVPHADGFKPRLKKQLPAIERLRLISTSLEGRPLDEFEAMLNQIAPLMDELIKKEAQQRKQLQVASRKRDRKRMSDLRAEMKRSRAEVLRQVRKIGYPDLRDEIDISRLLNTFGLSESNFSSDDAIPADGAFYTTKATKLPSVAIGPAPAHLDKTAARAWHAAEKAEFHAYHQLIKGMARASELTSPAPPGHFLRDFGQSDREVIENAANEASIPQALNLLNGKAAALIANRYSPVGQRVHAERSTDAKIRVIFRAMLTRDPTNAELQLLITRLASRGQARFVERVVWALLNTQQFLFVQ